jgi:hypothetical protein
MNNPKRFTSSPAQPNTQNGIENVFLSLSLSASSNLRFIPNVSRPAAAVAVDLFI